MVRLLAGSVLIVLLLLVASADLVGGPAAPPDAPRVLTVWVRQLPVHLAPGQACRDSELRALDLLYEGLVRLVPGPDGSTVYHPALALAAPDLVPPLGRTFLLPENARWSDGKPVSARDVRESYRLLREGNLGLSPAYADRLEEPNAMEENRLTLRLTQGMLEPQSFFTFRIIPAGSESAAVPPGSGRFAVKDLEASLLVANPHYLRRPGKERLPRLDGVHFVHSETPVEDLKAGKVDLALDLTTAELAKLAGSGIKLVPGQRALNRRITFLALHHAGPLAKVEFRRALAHALPVEALLDRYYRGEAGRAFDPVPHRALTWRENEGRVLRTSPFPRDAWPVDHTVGVADSDPASLRKLLGVAEGEALQLELLYPEGDPDLVKVVAEMTSPEGEAAKLLLARAAVKLTATALPPEKLRQRVEERKYQIAFYHYDFPDDTFWLRPLLGPRGPRGAGNIFGYLDMVNLLQEIDAVRDFAKVRHGMHQAHAKFATDLPFIPLWQLDAYAALGPKVIPKEGFDPRFPFADPDRWGKTP